MVFPDKKSQLGFRSKAQSRWAFATDQWWADEYERNTSYAGIPDRVNEDTDEGISDWGMPITENHPVISLWDEAIKELTSAKTLEEFESASHRVFKVGRIWNQDDNLKDKKIVKNFLGQYTLMIQSLEEWNKKAGDKIKPEIKDMWDKFIERHGTPKDDVWDPMTKATNNSKAKIDTEAYNMGYKAGSEVSSEVADWINFELSSNTGYHYSFLKGIVKGTVNNVESGDTANMVVNENALIRKAVTQTGLDKKTIEKFWEDSVKEEKSIHNEEVKNKKFWASVVERFKSKIRNTDILEAKRVMDNRKALRTSIDTFVTHLAKGDFDAAQGSVPEMIKNQLGTMINRKKEAYLRSLGDQVKERAKKV